MRDKMKDENLPAPHFSLKGIFAVTLYRPINFNKWIENWADKISKNQIKILLEINRNNNITQTQLSDLIGISKSAIYKNITKLKKLKILEHIGSDKAGYWTIFYKSDM